MAFFSGFRNAIVAGVTLIRDAIRSPDYQTGVSGWSINKDGTAEFQDVTARGEIEVTSLVAGTPGAGRIEISPISFFQVYNSSNDLVAEITDDKIAVYGDTSSAIELVPGPGQTAAVEITPPAVEGHEITIPGSLNGTSTAGGGMSVSLFSPEVDDVGSRAFLRLTSSPTAPVTSARLSADEIETLGDVIIGLRDSTAFVVHDDLLIDPPDIFRVDLTDGVGGTAFDWTDYEPQLYTGGGASTISRSIQYAKYMRIGNTVFATGSIVANVTTSGGVAVDLPFTSKIRALNCGTLVIQGSGTLPSDQSGIAFMSSDRTKLICVANTTGFRDIGTAGQTVRFSVCYEAEE